MASSSSKTSNIAQKRSKNSKIDIDLPKIVKRRGLYVEKKDTETSSEDTKSKSPPRRDKTSFLYTALTMLSKPSASTQFPDTDLHKASQSFTSKDSRRKIKAKIPPKIKINDNKDAAIATKKFRSRILNEIKDYKDDVTVLQPKKEIVQTPSNYSTAGVSRNVDSFQDVQDYSHEEKDRGLYNFFVDALENSIDVYNVNVEEQPIETKESNSVKFLEIDEEVVEKLKIRESDTSEEEIRHPIFTEHFDIRDERIETPMVKTKVKITKRERTKQRKAKEDRNRENKLLNILKEELSQTTEYHEPQNIFEALKQIVKNKKKSKMLRFEDKNLPKLNLKKRKILDFEKPNNYPDYKIEKRPFQTMARPIKAIPNESDESLKVYDFDQIVVKKENVKQNPVVLLTYHSSDELRDHFNPEVILQYSESDASETHL